ncbi:hypothetical protein [Nonomuraea sp. WAC 01424]|uniref:hypothetical protein n=1 Tax=Nonomuraea sp. WAC 01424 TaxID=2203200 RepID=UPI00163D38C7|nr:hypothetical protein [Nonomuraea sp. WAC 01424]
MPRNSSAARREQARALAAAEGISYTQALRRLDEGRTAVGEADGEEVAPVVQKSKKAVRARQAVTGEAYNAARRALDHDRDPAAAVWVLVTVALDFAAEGRDQYAIPTRQDRAAIALALSGVWKYATVPCPRVVVYPVEAGAHRMVLLTRLLFARPPAGGGLTVEELESLAEAARHALVMRGRRSATATAQLAPADDVDQLGEHAVEYGEHSPQIAERDWWRHALVRLTQDVTTGSPYTEPTHHRAGRVLDLWQTGRKDWPIDTSKWTTSLDIDLMGFVEDEAVELLEVLDETPSLLADQVEPMHARLARRWAHARALLAGAAGDDTMTRADWVLVHDHRQEVTRQVQDEVDDAARAEECPEPELLRLAADILQEVVQQGASGYQWDVDGTRAVAADLRALADTPVAGPHLRARLWAAEKALSTALQVDGAVGVDARLSPRERKEAEVRFGERLAAVLGNRV